MKISTKGRYALRILADIAEHGVEKNVPIREIAERQGFSDKYLEGIVSRLSSAGLVKSGRGKYGGYRLVKLPAEYNVYEIFICCRGLHCSRILLRRRCRAMSDV